jgi:hypothetical protein
MLTHTYHGHDVWEVRDRIGSQVSIMVNGPPARVDAVLARMALLWPDASVVSSVQQAQSLEVVLHRTAACSDGMALAA